MNDFIKEIEKAKDIVILGHMRPDGDCVGSCLSVYNYVLDNYPDKKVDVYMDAFKQEFMFLHGADQILVIWTVMVIMYRILIQQGERCV